MAQARRRWVRGVGWTVLVVLAVLAVAYAGLVVTTNRMLAAKVTLPVAVAPLTIAAGDEAALDRGRYLVDHAFGCKICHAQDLGGRAEVDNVAIGTLWGPNLTTGEGTVVRGYTATDWARAIRHGLSPTGRRLILMPSEDYYNFSDQDIGAVVAYVQSMPPVDRANQGISLGPVGRALLAAGEVQFAFDRIDHTAARSGATPGPTVTWGEVLVTTCTGCHGPGLSGGPIPGGDPSWPPARNLTRHETGVGAWAYDDFVTAMQKGRRPDGTAINPPMPWQAYAGLTGDDIQAMWLYLQTTPAKAYGGR